MSSQSGIPSNEDVVEELTKDLRSSAIRTDSCSDDASYHGESDLESDTANADQATEIRAEDYIDDEQLKERDEKLTEEEKRVGVDNIYIFIT